MVCVDREPGTAEGEVAAWPREPGTANEMMAEADALLEDDMMQRVRPVPSWTNLPAVLFTLIPKWRSGLLL
jgi:hypothetical protein